MSPKTGVLAKATKVQRAVERQRVGTLLENSVTAVTLRRYDDAIIAFTDYLEEHWENWPATLDRLDLALCGYIEHM